MFSALFIVNNDGIIVIEKQYREFCERDLISEVTLAIADKSSKPKDIYEQGDYTILLRQVNDIWLVGVCDGDDFSLFPESLLQLIEDHLSALVPGGISEFTMRMEINTVYQILDFSIDHGYPLFDEDNSIYPLLHRLPSRRIQLDLEKPWRRANVKWGNNQILLDVIETMNLVVSSNPRIQFCTIKGEIKATSHLSDNPICKLHLASSTHFDDATFHRSVQVDGVNSKTIQFIPPDGKFTLMNYYVSPSNCNLPITIIPKFKWSSQPGEPVTFDITFKVEATLRMIENFFISFDLPLGVNNPALNTELGRATYDSVARKVVWFIGSYKKTESATLTGNATTNKDFLIDGKFPVIDCSFQSIGVSPSGFKIEKLDVENIDYKVFKGIKTIIKSDNYEFRSGPYIM